MVQQVLQRFELHHSTVQRTPLAIDNRLTGPFPDEPFEPSGPYAELVDCLMYLLTCTCPDLAFPLSILARLVVPRRHRPVDWTATVRVAKSTQGYYFSLGSGAVSWRSTRSSSRHGQARFDFVESEANTVDIFTKALPPCDHQRCLCGDVVIRPKLCFLVAGLVTVHFCPARRSPVAPPARRPAAAALATTICAKALRAPLLRPPILLVATPVPVHPWTRQQESQRIRGPVNKQGSGPVNPPSSEPTDPPSDLPATAVSARPSVPNTYPVRATRPRFPRRLLHMSVFLAHLTRYPSLPLPHRIPIRDFGYEGGGGVEGVAAMKCYSPTLCPASHLLRLLLWGEGGGDPG
ncbi:unnamed protein product [Closterium sp. NIES-53]